MKRLLALLLVLAVALPSAQAEERTPYSQAELDQMLAPIALYPDALLSQVLMASTYPLEVVEAARWSRAHPGLKGEDAVRAAQDQDWDPSVKSLLAFPDLLTRMDEELDWTQRLGDAFLGQEPHVMETVQRLRRKAEAAGQLASDERLRVVDEGGIVVIEQAQPQVVYVPYYDPFVVYGAWWWSAYPPVVWAPWPGYYVHRTGFWWGTGVGVTAQFFFGGVDWRQRHVKVVHVNNFFVRPLHGRVIRPLHVGKWQRAPVQRREFQRRQDRPAQFVPRARPMPPALSASPPVRRVEQPRRIEQPRRVELPRAIEQPRRVEQPGVIEQPRRVEQPRVIAQPRRVDQPHAIEQPRRVEQPRAIEQPRRVEQPRVIEQPRRVEQPRVIEQPRRVEQPRVIAQPRRVDQPRVIEQPRRVELPRAIEQPRQVEQPRVIEQPRRVEQPRVIAQPRRVEAPRAQPRPQAQSRPGVQAPRQETRPVFRAQPRGPEGGRGGGWGRQADRNGRRG